MIARLKSKNSSWIDVNEPTEAELGRLAVEFQLSPAAVHDCLDSLHLPKYEKLDSADFIIVRYFDPEATGKPDRDTIRELTRKIAIFVGPHFLITVHREMPPFLPELHEKFMRDGYPPKDSVPLIVDTLRSTLASFELPLQEAQDGIDSFELHIFNNLADASVLESMYFVKRKISIYRRMIRQTLDLTHRMPVEQYPNRIWSALRERGERVFIAADDGVEEIRHLLNTHISLASHRTNEVMRVLTIFAAFLLPLTFIVGVYGMNFPHMPEFTWRYGYAYVWGIMILTTAGIYTWFRKQGWLR